MMKLIITVLLTSTGSYFISVKKEYAMHLGPFIPPT